MFSSYVYEIFLILNTGYPCPLRVSNIHLPLCFLFDLSLVSVTCADRTAARKRVGCRTTDHSFPGHADGQRALCSVDSPFLFLLILLSLFLLLLCCVSHFFATVSKTPQMSTLDGAAEEASNWSRLSGSEPDRVLCVTINWKAIKIPLTLTISQNIHSWS